MKLPRRSFLRLAACASRSAGPRADRNWAQSYPVRPVRIIIGFPPGGTADIMARLVGQKLSERLGRAFVIDNRAGAGSNIGAETVVRASPDGYTLFWATTSNAINAALLRQPQFQLIRDITPIAGVARTTSLCPCIRRSRPRRFRSSSPTPKQSRQDQHGVGRQRKHGSCIRRAVQDVGLASTWSTCRIVAWRRH